MSASGSVTAWLGRVKVGDQEAAQQLWQRYFDQLVRMARGKLRFARRRVVDEEDVALSAMDSFFRAAAAGKFPKLNDRHGLWPLLVTITTRKAIKVNKHEQSQKEGGGKVRGDSALTGGSSAEPGWQQVLGRKPDPAFAWLVAEEFERVLALLPESLRSVALWKMEGFTNSEIAAKLGRIERTVEIKLQRIRRLWAGERA
jgi:DNA-directed RNA polymerase specialized sigma24 family protein